MSGVKEPRWIYKSLRDTGLVIKKATKKCVYDGQGNAVDTVQTRGIKVNFVSGLLVINESMGKRLGYTPEVLSKLVEEAGGFNRWYWCIESPDKVLTAEESTEVEKALQKKDEVKGVEVITGPRSRGR